eukprot:SAG31_NODE_37150_length_306_cov_4.072464_1_plen_47_part_10
MGEYCVRMPEIPVRGYQDMSLRVVTSTGAPTIHQFSVLFKFSISLIF